MANDGGIFWRRRLKFTMPLPLFKRVTQMSLFRDPLKCIVFMCSVFTRPNLSSIKYSYFYLLFLKSVAKNIFLGKKKYWKGICHHCTTPSYAFFYMDHIPIFGPISVFRLTSLNWQASLSFTVDNSCSSLNSVYSSVG